MNFKPSIPEFNRIGCEVGGMGFEQEQRKRTEKELWQKNGGINMGRGMSGFSGMLGTEINSSKSESAFFCPHVSACIGK
jgi:hypothetical protein